MSLFNFPSSSDTILENRWKLFAQLEQGPPSTAAAAWLLNSCSEGGDRDGEFFENWNRPATVHRPFQVARQPPMADPPSPPPLVYLVAKVNIRGRAGWLSSHLGPPPPPAPVSQRQRPNCQQLPNFPSAATVVILLLPFLHKIIPQKLPYCPYHQQTLKTQAPLKLKQNFLIHFKWITTIKFGKNLLEITFCFFTLFYNIWFNKERIRIRKF